MPLKTHWIHPFWKAGSQCGSWWLEAPLSFPLFCLASLQSYKLAHNYYTWYYDDQWYTPNAVQSTPFLPDLESLSLQILFLKSQILKKGAINFILGGAWCGWQCHNNYFIHFVIYKQMVCLRITKNSHTALKNATQEERGYHSFSQPPSPISISSPTTKQMTELN